MSVDMMMRSVMGRHLVITVSLVERNVRITICRRRRRQRSRRNEAPTT